MTKAEATAQIAKLTAQGFSPSLNPQGRGFYYVHVRCDQCQALVINQTATHERGCPNERHECAACCTLIPLRAEYCEDCQRAEVEHGGDDDAL